MNVSHIGQLLAMKKIDGLLYLVMTLSLLTGCSTGTLGDEYVTANTGNETDAFIQAIKSPNTISVAGKTYPIACSVTLMRDDQNITTVVTVGNRDESISGAKATGSGQPCRVW